jgi:hypothetical protein
MKLMNRTLKQLRAQLSDATKRDENLRLIGEMQRGCVNAKSGKPEQILADAKDDPARAKISAEFRRELIAVMRKLLDAELSIADGKPEAAAAALDEVEKLREHAHEELGVRE